MLYRNVFVLVLIKYNAQYNEGNNGTEQRLNKMQGASLESAVQSLLVETV